jgi:hypothetical protein
VTHCVVVLQKIQHLLLKLLLVEVCWEASRLSADIVILLWMFPLQKRFQPWMILVCHMEAFFIGAAIPIIEGTYAQNSI